MKRPERTEEGLAADLREAHERVGYARCETDRAERQCAELRARREQLLQQIEAVRGENQLLEQELRQQLATWRQLDETHVRTEEILPRIRQVTGSLSYRLTSGLLGVINKVRRLVLPARPR